MTARIVDRPTRTGTIRIPGHAPLSVGALGIAAFLLFASGPVVRAEEPDALTIARKCDAALKGKTEHGSASMTVRTPEWQRTLEMTFWYDYPDKTLIRMTAPAKDAGTGTLRLGTNMWTYLPSVERVIKIPPSLMLQSWMGSDFTNDDLVKESSLPTDYTHRIEAETTEGGDLCYRLVATPKPNAAGGVGQAGAADPQGGFSPSPRRVLRRTGSASEDSVFRRIPQNRLAHLPHAMAHGFPQQAGTRNHPDVLFAGIRPADTREHIYAAESRAAFLRGHGCFSGKWHGATSGGTGGVRC